MAIYYVRSTDGNNSDNGSTWALAKQTITGALTSAAAGDTIYVSQAHNYSTSSSFTYTGKGTAAAPVSIICVSDSAMPPTALANTATETMTNTSGSTIGFPNSYYINWYGINFKSYGNFTLPYNCITKFNACSFQFMNATTAGIWDLNSAVASASYNIQFINSTLSMAHSGNFMRFYNSYSYNSLYNWGLSFVILFKGCTFSGTAPSFLLRCSSPNLYIQTTFDGCDLSLIGPSSYLLSSDQHPADGSQIFIRNCKMNANIASYLTVDPTVVASPDIFIDNSHASNLNSQKAWHSYQGSVKNETSTIRVGGATNGTNRFSWKLESNQFTSLLFPLESPQIAVWFNALSIQRTVTVSFIHQNSGKLSTADIWMDIEYQGTSDSTISNFASSRMPKFPLSLNATFYQDDAESIWYHQITTNVTKQKLQLSFTPLLEGFFVARFYLAKPNFTVFIDPFLRFN